MTMKYKVCCKCKVKKKVSEFNSSNFSKDGIQASCRPCANQASKASYHKHKKRYFLRAKEREKEIDKLFTSLKNRPCADCGGSFPPFVMDFDHLDQKKKTYNLAYMRRHRMAFAKILKEVGKCDLVCSNCHRIRTEKRSLFPCRYGNF